MNRKRLRGKWLVAVLAIAALALGVAVLAGKLPGRHSALPAGGKSRFVRVEPADPLVGSAERERRHADAAVHNVTLTAAPTTIRLGHRSVKTWAFNGRVPGPQISLRAGDIVRARVVNRLPAPLTVHWHGIELRNDMDGVPGMTQKPIEPGGRFVYTFTVPAPGTFFYHSHVGTQLDRGLYGPLIIEPKSPNLSPGREITLMLDDWIDGTGRTPDQVYAELRSGMGGMPGMNMDHGMHMDHGMNMDHGMDMGQGMSTPMRRHPLGSDTSDVVYPYYLINGRPSSDPASYTVEPGEPIRLRLINAGADTPFRVAFSGGRLTVIATDGYPVEPVTVDTLLIGMGERYDVLVTAPHAGVFPVVAVGEGSKKRDALAVLRAGPGHLPSSQAMTWQMAGRLLSYSDLHATGANALPAGQPDRTYTVALTGTMHDYRWEVRAPYDEGVTLPVRNGQRIRLVLENRSMMWHPIHLHGHTFEVDTGSPPGPRKDTVIVPPMGRVAINLIADNPGQWMLHCHNLYHAEAGMHTTLSYVK